MAASSGPCGLWHSLIPVSVGYNCSLAARETTWNVVIEGCMRLHCAQQRVEAISQRCTISCALALMIESQDGEEELGEDDDVGKGRCRVLGAYGGFSW